MSIVLIFFFLVSACGKGSKNTTSTQRTVTISEAEISAIMNNQYFDCSPLEGTDCPQAMARLLILDKSDANKSSVCTGFLVGEDTLITNHHCIKNQTGCENAHVAVYNGYSYEKNWCDRIIKTLYDYSDPSDPRKKLDVTIIKLRNKFYGKTFKLAKAKPKIYDSLTVWVVDHTGLDRNEPNFVESRLTEFKCNLTQDGETQSMLLDKCPVIAGNSGSPVLNSAGEVVGIIWGGTLDDDTETRSLWSRRLLFTKAVATDVLYFKDYIP